jgi:heme exporter protein D
MATRKLALAGLIGPPLFAAIVVFLTAIEWDFLHGIGWSAGLFVNPDPPWPSSTALGDYGFLQVLNFLQLGVSVLALAFALFRLLDVRRKVGPTLLALAGAALLGSAFRTDYGTVRGGSPDTWNGVIHGIAFFVFALSLLASMFGLTAQFRRDQRWRSLSRYSLIAGVSALAAIIANFAGAGNLFFYVFLAVTLSWLALVAAHAYSLVQP